MLTNKNIDTLKKGEHIILIGLFIQIIFFGLFALVAIIWHKRMVTNAANIESTGPSWKKHIYVLYTAVILIMVRSIIRVIEYIQGSGGYILTHESFLYIFDAALMLVAMVIFNVIHPHGLTNAGKGSHRIDNVELGYR